MPRFGEYETVEEPLRVTEAGEYSTIVWKTRRGRAGEEGKFYVVKQLAWGHGGAPGAEAASIPKSNGQERLKDFLEGVKQLEKSSSQAGRYLARVYASGASANSAWYATDYYPRRSLKEFINLQGGVESEALRQVVHRVVRGCLALQQVTGRSHGNLKAGNVLLAGKPQQLRKTPLHLVDPLPVRFVLQTGAKAGAPEVASDQALAAQTEMADLRAIGELIVQLVEGRIIQSAYDYNYPVAASGAWDCLGKDAALWLRRCNQLLNPQLKLNQLNLQTLERELRGTTSGAPLARLAGAVVVAAVLAAGLWTGLQHWRGSSPRGARALPKDDDWQGWMDFVRGAESRGDWTLARDTLQKQLLPKAQALRQPVLEQQTKGELDFAVSMAEAAEASRTGRLDVAKRAVEKALQQRPEQPAALTLKAQVVAAMDEQVKVKELTQLMESVLKAESKSQWSESLSLLAKAVLLSAPLTEPQYGQWVGSELKYAQQMEQAQSALGQGRYREARQRAEAALALKSRDGAATQIQAAAQTGEKYQDALSRAQDALDKKQYAEAERQVQAALLIKPAGTEAVQLSARVQDQGYEEARQAFEKGDYRIALEQCRVFGGTERFDQLNQQIGHEREHLQGLEQALEQGRYQTILGTDWPAKPGFERIKTAALDENRFLEQAQRKHASGDYSYVEILEKASYRTKPPFVALLEAGRRARSTPKTFTPVVVAKKSEQPRVEPAKPPVEAAQPPVAGDLRRLDENNKLLDYWQVLFGLKPSADRDIRREEPAKDMEYRLDQFDRLERGFVAAGAWDTQHKQQLDALRWLVSRGKKGEPPAARK